MSYNVIQPRSLLSDSNLDGIWYASMALLTGICLEEIMTFLIFRLGHIVTTFRPHTIIDDTLAQLNNTHGIPIWKRMLDEYSPTHHLTRSRS